MLFALKIPVGCKCHQHGSQQQQGHYGATTEVVHPHDLNVDFHRQHRKIAANHFGNAKLAHRVRKHDQGGTDQAVLGAWQGNGAELAPTRGAQCVGGLIQAAIGGCQRHYQQHQGMGKTGIHRGHGDTNRAIDRVAPQPALKYTLRAKPLNEGDGTDQRWSGQCR